MTPIQILMDEHQRILRTLDALEQFAHRLERGDEFDAGDLARFVGFFQRYADRFHHAKEEDHLFKRMGDAGFPADGGPVAVMLVEHDQGRTLVKKLNKAAGWSAPLSEGKRSKLANDMLAFADLLRGHIFKEDQMLYPMAMNALPDSDMAEMEQVFAEIRAEAEQSGELTELERTADELAERYAAG